MEVVSESPQKSTSPTREEHAPFPDNIPALHGLRGWMAMIVVVYHVFPENQFLAKLSYLAVGIFFVLSGFVLAHVSRKNLLVNLNLSNFGVFLRHRAARILPLYQFTTLATVALILLASSRGVKFTHHWDTSGWNVLRNLLALDIWRGIDPNSGSDFPFVRWSVTIEIWLYIIAFPALCLLSPFLRGKPVRIGVCALLTVILNLLTDSFLSDSFPLQRLIVRGLPYFALGFLVYSFGKVKLPRVIEAVLWTFCIISIFFPVPPVILTTCVLFVSANSAAGDPVTRFLSTPFSVFLGQVSYSVYLWHGVFALGLGNYRSFLARFMPSHFGQGALCLTTFVCFVLFVATLSYRYLELPFQGLIRGKRTKQQEPKTVVIGAVV